MFLEGEFHDILLGGLGFYLIIILLKFVRFVTEHDMGGVKSPKFRVTYFMD